MSCESFYFPKELEENGGYRQIDWWYKHDANSIKKGDKYALDWIDIRNLNLCNHPRPFVNLAKTIIEANVWKELSNENIDNKDSQHKALDFCASMNYFVRPAFEKRGFHSTGKDKKIDREWSSKTFWKVVRILKPKAICIASNQSYWEIRRDINLPDLYHKYTDSGLLEGTYHPGQTTWTRNGGAGGKLKFIELLKRAYK